MSNAFDNDEFNWAVSSETASGLRQAAGLLVAIARNPVEYPTKNAEMGRFPLTSYSDSLHANRAALRVIRQALDFLEADYLACEAYEIEFMETELSKMRRVREERPIALPVLTRKEDETA